MNTEKQIEDRQLVVILDVLETCADIEGDIVEFGCYEGDTSLAMAKLKLDKKLWLYDSFEGLPEKKAADISSIGQGFRVGELKASKNAVMKKFLHASLPRPIIKKAWFDELDAENDLPNKIAFALLDGDYYESIKTSLALVAPKLAKGGVIVVHDYRNEALPGAARAVDEFLANNPQISLRVVQGLAILD